MSLDRRAAWFGAAVGLQLLILVAVPARKIDAVAFGRTVVLRTAPVDPYSIMSGYYVTLGYDISSPAGVRRHGDLKEGGTVHVVLAKGSDGVWEAKSVHPFRPNLMDEEQVVIRGRKEGSRILYGIEAYYIPEEKREEVENALRRQRRRALVEVKVAPSGSASISRLMVGDKVYDY